MEKIVGEILRTAKYCRDCEDGKSRVESPWCAEYAGATAAIPNIASPRIQISHQQTPATMSKEFTRRFTTKYCLLKRIKFDSSEE